MSWDVQSEFIRLLFLDSSETDRFFTVSGVQLAQPTSGLFHFRRTEFSSQRNAKVGSTLVKDAALRVNLNLDGVPITSRAHTHPSHSQKSRLLTSSLSLGVPVPRTTQCRSCLYLSLYRFIINKKKMLSRKEGRRKRGHQAQREGQDFNNIIVGCHNVVLETRAQTFMLRTHSNPICALAAVKRSSHWLCDELKKDFLR